MNDLAKNGQLIVRKLDDQTVVEGVVGASPDLMALVGTVKEAQDQTVTSADQLERAIVAAAQSGSKVLDGYIKFAKPVTVKTRMQKASALAHQLQEGEASTHGDDRVAVSDLGFYANLSTAVRMATSDDDKMQKQAACDFVNNWIEKVELGKVDGSEVGLNVPVKVAFSDDVAKDWFLGLFNKQKKEAAETKSAATAVAEMLMEKGVDKHALLAKLSELRGKSGKEAAKQS